MLTLQGGPVLGDGSFDASLLRPLGIGGRIKVLVDDIDRSTLPLWLKMLMHHECCGKCGRWLRGIGSDCPNCGRISSWKFGRGLYQWWIHIYMLLWLFDFGGNHGWRKYRRFVPMAVRKQISHLGRWLWCNEWR